MCAGAPRLMARIADVGEPGAISGTEESIGEVFALRGVVKRTWTICVRGGPRERRGLRWRWMMEA